MERAIPARWLPSVSGTGRDHREGKAEAAAACLADPVSGLIDGDPGLDQEAIHQERDWDACIGRLRQTAIMLMRSVASGTAGDLFLQKHRLFVATTESAVLHLGSTSRRGGRVSIDRSCLLRRSLQLVGHEST